MTSASNIVLASVLASRYLAGDGHARLRAKLQFDTHPSKYRHWILAVDGEVARLSMKVQPFGGANTELELKSNSYDLSVDIELADAIQRLRFRAPRREVLRDHQRARQDLLRRRQIYMLAASTHPFKVNFCKYTNETRLAIEDASQNSGIRFLAACNGAPRAVATSWRWPATRSC